MGGGCTCAASTRFYLDCTLVREWPRKSDGDYGGAKPPSLPLSPATVVHMFEHTTETC